ncbi:MAG: hypothetical protein AAF514_21950 [Verrucomicrobiota bacterium]
MQELSLSQSALLTDLAYCVNRYRLFTPGIYVCVHASVELEEGTRLVPGLVAMVNHGRLKQCEATEDGFVGPPNFVLDVFKESEMEDYEKRWAAFAAGGVIEYVAVTEAPSGEVRCLWNRHDGASFERIDPDEDGVIKSKALPGLWFYSEKLQDRDWWAIGDLIDRGISRLGHHEFMETIWHKKGRDPKWGDWLPFESG